MSTATDSETKPHESFGSIGLTVEDELDLEHCVRSGDLTFVPVWFQMATALRVDPVKTLCETSEPVYRLGPVGSRKVARPRFKTAKARLRAEEERKKAALAPPKLEPPPEVAAAVRAAKAGRLERWKQVEVNGRKQLLHSAEVSFSKRVPEDSALKSLYPLRSIWAQRDQTGLWELLEDKVPYGTLEDLTEILSPPALLMITVFVEDVSEDRSQTATEDLVKIPPELTESVAKSYRKALEEVCLKGRVPLIGGTAHEQRRFFDEVIAKFPDVFWMEGCEAPTVRDHLVHFRLKPDAVPVARQPIPMSPYDDVRVEYHIEENVVQGKLRKIDTVKEGLPYWSTPIFVVDQDVKGLLGRFVCAYGPVNKNLETATFPSADLERAFNIAAGKEHHSLVDAIWGYTQFLLDDDTRRCLVICSRSGLHEWLRMPFGPVSAPAEMQSYVHSKFGMLRDDKGREFCIPLMDDIVVSSDTFEEHVPHMKL